MHRSIGWVGIGTLLIGVSGYVFLAVIGRALAGTGPDGARTAAALASLYLVANVLGPGIFVAVEQETSRRVGLATARHRDAAPVTRRTAVVAGVTAAGLVLVLAAGHAPLVRRALGGDPLLLVAVGVGVAGAAAVFWLRGVAGGHRDFGLYGRTLVLDAGVRLVGTGALAAADVRSGFAYGLVLGAAPLVAAVVLIGRRPRGPQTGTVPEDAPGWADLARSTGSVASASALSMAMANLVPVALGLLLVDDSGVVFAFAAAVVLTRAPLLLMGPVQAVMLPWLTAAVADDRYVELARRVRLALLGVLAVSVVSVSGWALVGRWLLRTVYGSAADLLSATTLALLAVAAGALTGVLVLQPVLLALRRHRGLLAGWVIGTVVAAAAFAVPLSPVDRAVVAQLVGPLTVLAVHGWVCAVAIRVADRPRPAGAPPPRPADGPR